MRKPLDMGVRVICVGESAPTAEAFHALYRRLLAPLAADDGAPEPEPSPADESTPGREPAGQGARHAS